MRPRGSTGEVRSAVVDAVKAEPRSHVGRIAEVAGTGRLATRRALDNACRAGELRIVDTCRLEHSRRPVALYDLAQVLDDMPRSSSWHETLAACEA